MSPMTTFDTTWRTNAIAVYALRMQSVAQVAEAGDDHRGVTEKIVVIGGKRG